jgi:hypothetical protein
MTDDERHGSHRGYRVHLEDDEDACESCSLAWYRYNKRATYLRMTGQSLRVPALGTQRRIRSLMALGYGLPILAGELGIATGNLSYKMQQPYMARRTHDAVADLYERLAALPEPAGWVAQRSRSIAVKRGWVKPDRWYDIDDPNEQPDPGYTERTSMAHGARKDVDEVVVQRILAGDMSLAQSTSRAEKVAVVARWSGSHNELERLTGWQAWRYTTKEAS